MENEVFFDENKNKTNDGTLYLVTTPIGNLSDITYRAVKVLREVSFIAAEDTRNTKKLLRYFDISKEVVSYYEHNKVSSGNEIVSRLLSGESCALVTDAGTPAISDPGEDLVRLCAENNIPVTAAPGVSAAITALTLSALDTRKFVFEGFLPVQKSERKERLDYIKSENRTLIIYEAPHKLCKTLNDLYATLGERKISLCRELTKLNEEVMRTSLSAAIKHYETNEPRGEYVLIIEGSSDSVIRNKFWSNMTISEHVDYYIAEGMAKNDAIKAAAKDRGVPKNVVYNEYVK